MKKNLTRVSTRALLTAACAAGAATPAVAQTPPDLDVETIVVEGKLLSVQRAIETKRNADAILDAISADEIGKLPVKNAAEAIDFLPGVSLEIDQGEGRYVTIRGAASALNNVTLNGVSIGSPEGSQEAGGGRVAPLDVVGGELLKGIEVVKAVTPDMDHQAIGGSVNILTYSPFDFDGRFGFGSISGGYGEYGDKFSYRASGTYGDRLGANRDWGFLIGASYSVRDFQSRGVFPDDWAPAAVGDPDGVFTELDTFIPEQWKSNQYDIERERLAINAALEYQPTDESKYSIRALWSAFNEDEVRTRYAQRIADQDGGLNFLDDLTDGVGSYSGLQRENELRREQKDKRIFNVTAGSEHQFGAKLLELEFAYNDNQQEEPNTDWEFRDTSTSGTFNTNQFLFDLNENPATTQDPDGYRFQRLRFQTYEVDTTGFIAKGDLTWGFGEGDPEDGSYIKGGFNYRNVQKEQDFEEERYGRGETCTLGEFGLSGGLLVNDVDGQDYELGPIVDGGAVDQFFIDQPQCFELSLSNTVNDGFLEDFDVEETVLAGYLMANIEVTDRLTLIGGVRIEDTEVDADGFEVDQDLNVTPVNATGDYTNILPSVHVRYDVTENFIARFAWTNTIGRPFLEDISPSRSLDFEDNGDGTFVGSFSSGNPDLEAFESRNFDLSLEYYLPDNLGIVSAAVFHKNIDGFIIGETAILAGGVDGLPPTEFEGRLYSNLTSSRPINADEGKVSGVELGYQQRWDFLPGVLGNLGAGLNLTFVDSELEVNGRDLPFVRQSDKLVGAQLFYQDERFEAVLTYNYNSEYLDGIGGSPDLDTYYNDRERLDFKGRYRFTDKLDLFVEWQNINDEPDWEYQGIPNRVTGYELYGQTIFIGFNGRL